jgi:lipoyl(octanoyl) transferase
MSENQEPKTKNQKPKTLWRLLLPNACEPPPGLTERAGEAAWNMALDEALFEAVQANDAPPTLRLYEWKRPAITLGRFQNSERTLNPGSIQAQDLPLVRRITGGRGILHGDDLTICLVSPLVALGLPENASVLAVYERIAAGYVRALASLGVAAIQGVCQRQRGRDAQGDCFAAVSRADIIEAVTGRKLLGAALYRRGDVVLQQASVPFRSRSVLESPFRGESSEVIPVGDASGNPGSLIQAVVEGIGFVMGVSLRAGSLTEQEARSAQELVRGRYLSEAWTQKGVYTLPGDEIDS